MEMTVTRLAELIGLHESLLDLWLRLDAPTQWATSLVLICDAGADRGLRAKYAIKWWGSFLPERVTLAALTSGTLQDFTADLIRRLRGQIGYGDDQRDAWRWLIGLPEGEQRQILDVLETQAAVCTTLVRASLDARRKDKQNHGETKTSDETTEQFDGWGELVVSGDGSADILPAGDRIEQA